MVKFASLFSQVLHHFPRHEFARLVKEHRADYRSKGFTCWAHFVCLLFCQLAGASSLRDITSGLKCCLGKLRHLGITRPVCRSTLSYANNHRPDSFFEALFYATLHHFQNRKMFGPPKRFRFKNPLHSIDSTTISLCLEVFPWAKFKYRKGGIKLHVLLDHNFYLPTFIRMTLAREADVHTAKLLNLPPGAIITMDKAYTDYQLFARWTEQGVFFVIRQKQDAVFKVVKNRPLPENRNVLADQIIRLTGPKSKSKCPHLLRRVKIYDPEHDRELVFLTNHLEFGSTTIAGIYKQRWQIELFFKAIKQNLRIKSFVGTSPGAIWIQIWTALIAMIILRWLHHLSKTGWSIGVMVYIFSLNLFTYRDLLEWLEDPYGVEPISPGPVQLTLPISILDSCQHNRKREPQSEN